jgi:hypothetical protein
MPRPKRNSITLNKAKNRLAGMLSISRTLNFSDGLSVTEYDTRIRTLETKLTTYNTMLSTVDEMAGQIGLLEQELNSYSEKMLMSVGTRYGKDSLQYMQAGGKPRKRSTRAATTNEPEAIALVDPTNAIASSNGTKADVN